MLILGALIMMAVAGTQTSEEAAVRAAVNHYVQGHATGSPQEFSAAFHDKASLFWVDAQGQLATRTSAEYIARAAGHPAADEAKRIRRIVFVDITGTAAVAKVELDYPDAHMFDYLSLLKINGEWRIINKIFNTERRTPPMP